MLRSYLAAPHRRLLLRSPYWRTPTHRNDRTPPCPSAGRVTIRGLASGTRRGESIVEGGGASGTTAQGGGEEAVEDPRSSWETFTDADGAKYYFNARTGETQWTSPDPAVAAREALQAKAAAKPGKLAAMAQAYGPTFVVWWTSVWLSSGLAIYGGLEASGADAVELLRAYGVEEYVSVNLDGWSSEVVNVPIAFALNELAEVVRFPLVAASTPLIKRRWDTFRQRREGYP